MKLAKVIGTIVSTRKDEEIVGLKLLLVKDCDETGQVKPGAVPIAAADAMGAGFGEVVLYASGSSARQTSVTHERPVDATIMAIVDLIDVGGDQTYCKDE